MEKDKDSESVKYDLNKETKEAVYFYTPKFYSLDNFSAYTIEIWGEKFQTSEHAYQWKKYAETNPKIAQQILEAPSPHAVKEISDSNKDAVSPGFHETKLATMEEILKAKVQQHKKVLDSLIETGDREIIENSPLDDFWGIGPNNDGENALGKIWMRIRKEL